MSGLVCVGDNVVDIYPATGMMYPGGNTLNVAVAARRRGARAAYLGAVGTDPAGRLVRSALEKEGVETERLRLLEGPNAWCTIELTDGDRRFVDHDLGVSRFLLDEADLSYLERFGFVHSGDCSGTEGQLAEMSERTRLSFDFSNRPASYYRPLLPHCWLACFSGSHLSDEEADALANEALGAGNELVLVTKGSRGASAYEADGRRTDAAAAAVPVVDTLGAGDVAIGVFLASLLAGDDLRTALQAAMREAIAAVTRFGAFGYGTPTDADAAPAL